MRPSPRQLALVIAAALLVGVAGSALGHWLDPTRHLAAARIARPTPFVLPDFELADQDGQRLGTAELAGHVWVADFLFLQCGDTCARLSRQLLRLQQKTAGQPWAAGLRFVSFSVDPEDDAAALVRYRRSYQRAPDRRWSLVAADRQRFPALAVAMGLADSPRDVPDAFVASSRFLFLIDARGVVRGSYDGFSEPETRRLARDLEQLARNDVTP